MGGFRPDFGDGGDRAIVRSRHRAIGRRNDRRRGREGAGIGEMTVFVDWRRAEAGSALRLLGVGDGAEGGEEFVE